MRPEVGAAEKRRWRYSLGILWARLWVPPGSTPPPGAVTIVGTVMPCSALAVQDHRVPLRPIVKCSFQLMGPG